MLRSLSTPAKLEAGAVAVVGMAEAGLGGHLGAATGFAALLVATGAGIRRLSPLVASVLVALSMIVNGVAGASDDVWLISATVAILVAYSAGAYLAHPRSAVALAVGLGGIWLQLASESATLIDALLPCLGLGAPWAAGRVVYRLRLSEERLRKRTDELEAAQQEIARLSALGERRRIARELHDVLAHAVTMMVVQAGAAERLMVTDQDGAIDALRRVHGAGREAINDLGRLLGFLRSDEDGDEDSLGPLPGLDELPALVRSAEAAGTRTSLSFDGGVPDVSPGLGLAVYRITQEALTNAIRHGSQDVEVVVRHPLDTVVLEVVSQGEGAGSDVGGSGHGLSGIKERVALYGGSVEVMVDAETGYRLIARLRDVGLTT